MTVLAFLTDPEVVQKILAHLGLPTSAPALTPARTPQPELGFALAGADAGSEAGESDAPLHSRAPSDRSPP